MRRHFVFVSVKFLVKIVMQRTMNACSILMKRSWLNDEQHHQKMVRNIFGFGSHCDNPDGQQALDACPSRACNDKRKRRSILKWLFATPSTKQPPTKKAIGKPDIRCCRKRWHCQKRTTDPDFSEFGGQAYKTCGIAYIIQRDRLPDRSTCESRENRQLRIIENHPDVKGTMRDGDPVKETENMGGRLLEMSDRGLHPLYKKLAAMPASDFIGKCTSANKLAVRPYRAISPPLDEARVPAQVRVNWKVLERKNLYWAHKQVEPPTQLIGRIIETKRDKKKQANNNNNKGCGKHGEPATYSERRDTVFDSLEQKHMKFIQTNMNLSSKQQS